MISILWVALGGAVGAVARYGVGLGAARWLGLAFPWGTLIVNVLGGFAMGYLAARIGPEQETLRLGLGVGVLGGFTTFSSFSMEFALMIERGAMPQAAIYVAVSLVAGFAALFAGLAMMRAA